MAMIQDRMTFYTFQVNRLQMLSFMLNFHINLLALNPWNRVEKHVRILIPQNID